MSAQTVKEFIYNTAQTLSIALNQNILPSFGWMSLLSFKDVDGEPVEVSASDPIPVTVSGAVSITTGAMTSATLSNVSSSASSVTLLASNTNRRSMCIHNDSTEILYLKFGATASASSYTVKIPADGFYEMPQPVYTGIIDGIWSSANGAARLTEGV